MHHEEVRLSDLRPGALFVIQNGIMAVKSEYLLGNGHSQCVLLESGEYAYFSEGDKTLVREIAIDDAHTLPPPVRPCEHLFIILTQQWEHLKRSFTLRSCQYCGLTHRLVCYSNPNRWVWEHVPEMTQEYFHEESRSGNTS